jgi:uncharacterized membrane protein YphA (DoxX/SURF4 family)
MNNPWVKRTAWIAWGCRVWISGLFLWAGWVKVLDPVAFARSIDGYQMIPLSMVGVMAWVLPWLEIWTAVALWVSPVFRKAACGWIFLMLVVFTVAKASAVLRGLDIECGCTGSETPLGWGSVVENVVYLVLTGVGLVFDRRVWK